MPNYLLLQRSSLLYDLYGIHAMTGCEWPMIAFVREYAAESLAALRAAIPEANGSFSPKVAACLQMIPEGTSEANEAMATCVLLQTWDGSSACSRHSSV